jgi:hypothetical protein
MIAAILIGAVCGVVGLILNRRRRTEVQRQARRLASLGTVEGHREARRHDGR